MKEEKKNMQSAKEKLENLSASAKAGMEKTKATVQGKVSSFHFSCMLPTHPLIQGHDVGCDQVFVFVCAGREVDDSGPVGEADGGAEEGREDRRG